MTGFAPALVIFDCDGTLVDSETLNNHALIDVLHEDGFGPYTVEDALTSWAGNTISTILMQIQMETERMPAKDIVQRYIRRVASLQGGFLKPVIGALETVCVLKGQVPMCVASNGERQNVLTSLTLTGFMDFFNEDQVFTKSQVKNPKPAPDLFLFAMQRMGFDDSSRCLVIEDSMAGVMAGAAAGMQVWGFTGTAHDKGRQVQALIGAGAHHVWDDFIHIRDHITL